MNVAIVTARILFGSIFVVFGLNGFLHFLPQPPVPEAAGAFFGALAPTGYIVPLVFGAQLVVGGLVLAGMVPLGVAILAPVIVSIAFFHVFLAPAGMGPAGVVTVLALFLTWAHRDAYAALFATTDRRKLRRRSCSAIGGARNSCSAPPPASSVASRRASGRAPAAGESHPTSAMRSSRRWSRSRPSSGRWAMRSDWSTGTGNSLGPIPLGPRRQLRVRAVLAGFVAALALSARAGASTWTLDPNATRVEFSVRNLSVASVHGGFHLASGTVQLNAEDVLHSTIEAVMDAASIDTDEPKRDAHLRSADFLDVGVYPTIAFKSTRIEHAGDDRWTVTGQLTLHGTTREVVLDVQRATLNGDRASAHASTTIDRRDFGITYGDFAVGKEVAITIDTVGIKKVTDGTGGPATPSI